MQSPNPNHRRWRGLLAAGFLLLMLFAGYAGWNRYQAHRLFQQAQKLEAREPLVALDLYQRSVAAAGGDYPEAQTGWLLLLARLHRWDEALGCLTLIRLEAAAPAALQEFVARADASGQPRVALAALTLLDRPGRHQAGALRLLVGLLLKQQRSAEALPVAQRWVAAEPANAAAWQILGELHRQRREIAPARDAFRAAARQSSGGDELRFIQRRLAELAVDLGDVAEARTAVDALLAHGQPSDQDQALAATVLRLEGSFAAALALLDGQIANNPKNMAARMVRGIVRLDTGDLAGAINDLTLVVSSQPTNKEAHYKLSQALQRTGQAEAAARHRDTATRLTDATLRLLDVDAHLARAPHDAALRQEREELARLLGRP